MLEHTTHAARYSMVRFLPDAETEEFTNVGALPEAMLLAISEPQGDDDRKDAFRESCRELTGIGAVLVPANDEFRITQFAHAAAVNPSMEA